MTPAPCRMICVTQMFVVTKKCDTCKDARWTNEKGGKLEVDACAVQVEGLLHHCNTIKLKLV